MLDNEIATQETTTAIEATDREKTDKYVALVEPRLQDILKWKSEGMNDYSIAEKLGIHYNTLTKYKAAQHELSDLYIQAQDKRNCLVVNAVFKRAIGYDYEETTTEADKLTKTVTKHVPGDVNAQKFHLINRDSEHWQPENRIENSHIIINNFQLPQLEADLAQIAEKRKALELQLGVGFEHIE
jgi:hypothetical protein